MWWQEKTKILRNHLPAIILGMVAALIVSLPTFLSVRDLGSAYKGMPFMYQDYESTYMSRVRDILDGHPSLGSPLTFEYKNSLTPLAPIGEYFYALPTLLLGISLPHVVVLSKFFFPLVLFLLIYALAYSLMRHEEGYNPKLYASAAATTSILGYDLVHIQDALRTIVSGTGGLELSIWTRLVNPITGGILLFVFLLSMWQVITGKKFAWIWAGALLGLMSGYIFSFGIGSAFLIIMLAVSLLQKRFGQTKAFGGVLAIGAIMVFTSAWGLIHSTSTLGQASALKNGLLLTHMYLMSKPLLLTAILMAICVRWKGAIKESGIFIGVLILSVLVAMNQQIITGRTVWPQHFVQYAIPISVVALSYILSTAFPGRFNKARVGVASALILLSVLFSVRTINSYKYVLQDFTHKQSYMPALEWLSQNASKDCVVLVREEKEVLNPFVTAFTGCNSYYTSYVFTGIPDDRIKHSFFSLLRLNGVKPDEIEQYLNTHDQDVQANFFRDWKEIFRHTNNAWLISISDRPSIDIWFDNLKKTLVLEYKEFYKKDFHAELLKYRLDYVMSDASAPPKGGELPSFLKPVYSNDGMNIYEVL